MPEHQYWWKVRGQSGFTRAPSLKKARAKLILRFRSLYGGSFVSAAKEIQVRRRYPCESCWGSGSTDGTAGGIGPITACRDCAGTGEDPERTRTA